MSNNPVMQQTCYIDVGGGGGGGFVLTPISVISAVKDSNGFTFFLNFASANKYLQPSGIVWDSPTWQSFTVQFSLIRALLQITLPVMLQLEQEEQMTTGNQILTSILLGTVNRQVCSCRTNIFLKMFLELGVLTLFNVNRTRAAIAGAPEDR